MTENSTTQDDISATETGRVSAFKTRRSFVRGVLKLALLVTIAIGLLAGGMWLIEVIYGVDRLDSYGDNRHPVEPGFLPPGE